MRKRRLSMEMIVWVVTGMALYLRSHLSSLPGVPPGKLPNVMEEILSIAPGFVLPGRRARHYPRTVKKRPQRYPLRPSSKA